MVSSGLCFIVVAVEMALKSSGLGHINSTKSTVPPTHHLSRSLILEPAFGSRVLERQVKLTHWSWATRGLIRKIKRVQRKEFSDV